MSEQSPPDSSSPHSPDDDSHDDSAREAPRGRSELVIVFGIVAIVAMIFGFVLGRLF